MPLAAGRGALRRNNGQRMYSTSGNECPLQGGTGKRWRRLVFTCKTPIGYEKIDMHSAAGSVRQYQYVEGAVIMVMNWQAGRCNRRRIALAACLLVGIHAISTAGAQERDDSSGPDDDATVTFGSLMWATEVNREDTIWRTASRYCRALEAGGHSDWRLPTLEEIETLYVPDSSATYKIRSPLELDSCCVWTMTNLEDVEPPEIDSILDEAWSYAWGLMFYNGGRYYSAMHQPDGQALCVRDIREE